AAEHRACRRSDRAAHRPDRDGTGPPDRVRVRLADERHRRRHHRGGCRALQETGDDEGPDGWRQAAGGRGDDEDAEAGGEGSARPDAIRQRPCGEKERGEHQRVAVDDPLQPGDAAAEIAADRGQGDVDDNRVEGDDEEPEQGGRDRRGGPWRGTARPAADPGRLSVREEGRGHGCHVEGSPSGEEDAVDRGIGSPSLRVGKAPTVDTVRTGNEIREFLTSRRARITPEQSGLPAYGGRRRVSGLRREEFALLAGISVEYYVQLERGSVRGVSEDVLEAVARALQLDEVERAHLFDLVRAAKQRTTRRRPTPERV